MKPLDLGGDASRRGWLPAPLELPPKNLPGALWLRPIPLWRWLSKVQLLCATFKIKINELMANWTEAGLGKVKDWMGGVGKHWANPIPGKSVPQSCDGFGYARHTRVLFFIIFPSTSLSCKVIYPYYIYWELRKHFRGITRFSQLKTMVLSLCSCCYCCFNCI